MLRIGIIGASGYTGVELARILANHPHVELSIATSRQYAGKTLASIFPNLIDRVNLTLEAPDIDRLLDRADCFFTAVPHGTAMDLVPLLLAAGKQVIDLSADYRLRRVQVYEAWYRSHTSAELLPQAVYGLPELYRDQIRSARLVANPGCYPTSIILALTPLLRQGLIDTKTVIVDAKSGTTGAGRSLAQGTLFCEVTDGFRPYKVAGTHRHTPEIEQELSALAGQDLTLTFTPHLLPISRGILSTSYATLKAPMTEEELDALYRRSYEDEPFVRICAPGTLPATQYVRGSNCCDIAVKVDSRTGRVLVLSAIDNIVKGASGQAVHNMNLMCGFPEDTGLRALPLFP
jgi:N-acetyl-gamma-glutamyl-phosphate reductase